MKKTRVGLLQSIRKYKQKIYIFFLSISFFNLNCFTQVVNFSDKILTFDHPLKTSNYVAVARDKIRLEPGFSFIGSAINTLSGSIDENLIFDLGDDYFPTEVDPSASPDFSLPVGSIAGKIDVSPTGAASYTIPISVSPGTMGVQPNISIVYNSQSGNGLLGIGWNIAGLSAITRVPANIYTDGNAGGVNLDLNDRFALDGNRLLVSTGTYGVTGSTYKTQNQTFATVTAYGSAGNGPQYFIVTAKDGSKLYYGNTSDSRVCAVNTSTPYMWRLNKVMDANGNYMTFTYNTVNGESVIDQIDYTGNATAGLSTYNSLRFYYDEKEDKNTLFLSGGSINQNLLLREIRSYSSEDILWKYNFYYTLSGYTHLNKIIELNSDGNQLNPTIINWGNKATTYSKTGLGDILNGTRQFMGDFNGDGRTDIFTVPYFLNRDYTENDLWNFYITGSTGTTFELVSTGPLPNKYILESNKILDIDGDGSDEMILAYKVDNGIAYRTYKLIGSAFTDITTGQQMLQLNDYPTNAYPVDYDGDGKFEVFHKVQNNTNWTLYYNVNGEWWLREFTQVDTWGKQTHIIDFDGDGIKDIMTVDDNITNIYKFKINSSYDCELIPIYTGSYPTNSHRIFPADFNGDNKTDLLTYSITSNSWAVRYSTGTGFVNLSNNPITRTIDPDASSQTDNYFIGDHNGDGKSDIIEFYFDASNNKIINAYYSSGKSFYKESIVDNEIDYLLKGWCYDKFFDANGDGKADIFLFRGEGSEDYLITTHPHETHHLIASITDGLNNTSSITYKSISASGSGYTKGAGAVYPLIDLQCPLYVAKTITTPNGIGGSSVNTYNYSGAKAHKTGLGFLGFENTNVSNNLTGYKNSTTLTLNNTYYTPASVTQNLKTSSDQLISSTVSTFTPTVTNGSVFNVASPTVATDALKNITITNTYTYNTLTGDLTSDKIQYSDGSYVQNNYYDYVLGKPGRISKVSKHKDDANTFSSQIYFNYNGTTGNLLIQKANYGITGKEITTTYTNYNSFGSPRTITTTAPEVETITSNLTYDATGRFITTKTSDFGSLTTTYNPKTGQKTEEVDEMGLKTTYSYDNWGRLISTTSPTGVIANNSFNWYTGTAIANALFYTYSTATNMPWVKIYYDAQGRKLKEETVGYGDVSINTTNNFNSKGQLTNVVSAKGSLSSTKTYTYDTYGRPSTLSTNSGKSISFVYSNLSTTTTINGNAHTRTFDCMGKLKQVIEPITNHTITYNYFSNGKPGIINIPGATISMEYDNVGNQTALIDPDAGTSIYDYDAYGRIIYQKDGNDNENWMYYDSKGRLDYSKDQNNVVTDYTYVTSGDGIHQLSSVTRGDNTKSYNYDGYGRIIQTTEHINGISDQVYQWSYNINGNPTQVIYPSGITVTNTYDSYSNLQNIACDGSNIWTLNTDNGLNYNYTLGNGVITYNKYDSYGNPDKIYSVLSSVTKQGYDYSFNASTGNLSSRSDLRSGYTNLAESFIYDKLDRLKSATFGSTTYSYDIASDGTGNITNKSDMGIYTYGNSAKPHQLTQISGVANLIGEQDIEYTTFNKVNSITQGIAKYSFTYGIDNQRRKMVYTKNGVPESTTYYFDMNEIVIKNAITRHLNYIFAGDGLAAIYVKRNDGNDTLYYVHKDHLGSIMALSNNRNTTFEYQNFDAWGRYRDPNTWAYSNSVRIRPINRGYTGHEHLLACNLINMNGRVYDPLLGMFLSPDPFVQAPDFTQNFNRYSYCLNNPLMYTDPSGNEFKWWHIAPIFLGSASWSMVFKSLQGEDYTFGKFMGEYSINASAFIIGAGVGGAVSQIYSVGGAMGGAISGAAGGYASGFTSGMGNSLLNGNNIYDAYGDGLKLGLIGGASGALLGGIGGGIQAKRNGMDFWDGEPLGRPMYITSEGNVPVDYYEDLTQRVNEQRAAGITDSWEQRLHKTLTDRINNSIGLDVSGNVPQSRNLYINDKYFKGDINYSHRGFVPKGESVTLSINDRSSLVINQTNYRWTQGIASSVNRMSISMSGTPIVPSNSMEIIITPSFDFRIIGLWVP